MDKLFSPKGEPRAPQEESRDEKLKRLRIEIQRAEERGDESHVLMVEAELKAAEEGRPFDRARYKAQKERNPKGKVLKQLQTLNPAAETEWNWDGYYERSDYRSYDEYFEPLLELFGYDDFEELVEGRSSELSRPMTVLDLFGGAYFLRDLEHVKKIVAARLLNRDEHFDDERIRALARDPKRTVLEGNLYEGNAWKRINEEVGDSGGFDLITCRPVGPFGHQAGSRTVTPLRVASQAGSYAKEEIYITLLNRSLSLLSPDGGMLFVQKPVLDTPLRVETEFWSKYTEEKGREGFKFYTHGKSNLKFAVQRNPVNT